MPHDALYRRGRNAAVSLIFHACAVGSQINGFGRHANASTARLFARNRGWGQIQIKVGLGKAGNRMTNYYNLRIIIEAFEINRSRLAQATPAFFVRRGTAIRDEVPDGCSPVV